MKFQIDIRFIITQTFKAVAGYLIGVWVVLHFLSLKNPWDFIGTSLVAGIFLYFIYFYPRNIYVNDGLISFKNSGELSTCSIALSDIIDVKTESALYNTLICRTKDGAEYRLHPKKLRELEKALLGGGH